MVLRSHRLMQVCRLVKISWERGHLFLVDSERHRPPPRLIEKPVRRQGMMESRLQRPLLRGSKAPGVCPKSWNSSRRLPMFRLDYEAIGEATVGRGGRFRPRPLSLRGNSAVLRRDEPVSRRMKSRILVICPQLNSLGYGVEKYDRVSGKKMVRHDHDYGFAQTGLVRW